MSFELDGSIYCCSTKAYGKKCIHDIKQIEEELIDYMKKGGVIRSLKRGDIAYYSIQDGEFYLRYDLSTNNSGNYDTTPVIFNKKYISTFKKTKIEVDIFLIKNKKELYTSLCRKTFLISKLNQLTSQEIEKKIENKINKYLLEKNLETYDIINIIEKNINSYIEIVIYHKQDNNKEELTLN